MQVKRFCQFLFVFLLLSSGIAQGQVITGTISGTVSDATGAVVPSATVGLRNVNTGISRTVTTDAAGRYRAPQLALGTYEVSAEAAGFQTVVRGGITLTVGREAVVDFTLQVGAVAERITVTGEAPLIETTNATVSSLMEERAMRDLPLISRSFADLTSLQPGVVSDLQILGAGSTAVFSGGGTATRRSLAGTKPQQSTYLLDGIEITTPSQGMPVNSVLGEQLGVDAIREFSLLQSNFGAQYGRAAGGVVNAVTQSGTNEFHGSAFEFLRNDVLNARDYFLSRSLDKQPLKRNQFGGSLGGPIQKDRTFFFLNYEGLRQAAGEPRIGATITPETRAGKVSPDIKFFLDTLPLPNGPSRGAGVADLYSVPRWNAAENYGMARIDRQLSGSDNLFGRLTIDRSNRTDFGEWILPGGYIGFQTGGYILAAISETHIFSPSVLNIARVGFTRRNDRLFYNYSNGGEFFPQGNPGLDPRLSPIKGVPLGQYLLPGVDIYLGLGPNTSGPALFVDSTFDYDDSLIINRGRHSITLGGNVKRYRMNQSIETWMYGMFSWQTIEAFLNNQPFSTTQLIGHTVPGLQVPDEYRGYRQTYGALYLQDDFRVLPNLTVNLGLRWERISGPTEINGKLAALFNVYTDKSDVLLGKGDSLFEITDGLGGFSPRVGFAWTPFADQKTVLRGGFGAFKEMPMEYYYGVAAMTTSPYSIRYQVNAPLLKFPYPFADEARVAGAGEPFIVPTDVKTPYNLQWTFSLERQVTQTLVVKANYLGLRGIDLYGVYNPNQKPTQLVNGRPFVAATGQVPNPNYTAFRYMAPIHDQIYNSGQLVLDKRFAGGLRFNTSYTWSRNIDNGGGVGTRCTEQVSGAGSFAVYNSQDLSLDKSVSSLHIKHNFIASYTYDLPFGSGRHWGSQWPVALNYLLGGWTLNGSHSWRSGLPVNVIMTPRFSNCVAQSCTERPDLRSGGNNNPVLDNWTPERYFDPSQFVLPPTIGFFGNVARNTITRPSLFAWNLSVAKDFALGEARNLEFRSEFFNILNHPNFGAPNANIFRNAQGNPTPGVARITSLATSMRNIQFGWKFTF